MSILARRYAKALFLQAQQEDVLDQVTSELRSVMELMKSTDLDEFLSSPNISFDSKQRVLNKVEQSVSGLLRRFLDMTLKRRRIREIPNIYEELLQMEDEMRGIERASVTTAVQLTQEHIEKLRTELNRLMNKEIMLEPKIKPEIIGGVIVEMGDYMIDGSMAKEIRDIRDRLRQVKVN